MEWGSDRSDVAAMEPGHEDREDITIRSVSSRSTPPQWSPVMKTGKTARKNSAG